MTRALKAQAWKVDESDLVFTTVNEAGSFEMSRIPLDEIAQGMESPNISFEEDPPGSGLFGIPSRGLTPDPDNPGLYLIGA